MCITCLPEGSATPGSPSCSDCSYSLNTSTECCCRCADAPLCLAQCNMPKTGKQAKEAGEEKAESTFVLKPEKAVSGPLRRLACLGAPFWRAARTRQAACFAARVAHCRRFACLSNRRRRPSSTRPSGRCCSRSERQLHWRLARLPFSRWRLLLAASIAHAQNYDQLLVRSGHYTPIPSGASPLGRSLKEYIRYARSALHCAARSHT